MFLPHRIPHPPIVLFVSRSVVARVKPPVHELFVKIKPKTPNKVHRLPRNVQCGRQVQRRAPHTPRRVRQHRRALRFHTTAPLTPCLTLVSLSAIRMGGGICCAPP